MAGRVELPLPDIDYPPHIRNHIADFDEANSRYTSYSNNTSPSGPSDGSQPSVDSPFSDFKLHDHSKGSEKPKRRGPKPDSKPPLTRKQELNRQAQRTHRERKEKYVKSLEEDVSRLREAFTFITKEKAQILQENRRLKGLLGLHGIIYNPEEHNVRETGSSYQQQNPIHQIYGEVSERNKNYDEIGVDFVLALEKPCMAHMTPLTSHTANNPSADFHGHALCMSCPPERHSIENPNVPWDFNSLGMQAADLSILFNLSNRLQLEGEMTPITVWAVIARHERFSKLELDDFEMVKQDLVGKVRCYGFGAVVKEHDVISALNQLFE